MGADHKVLMKLTSQGSSIGYRVSDSDAKLIVNGVSGRNFVMLSRLGSSLTAYDGGGERQFELRSRGEEAAVTLYGDNERPLAVVDLTPRAGRSVLLGETRTGESLFVDISTRKKYCGASIRTMGRDKKRLLRRAGLTHSPDLNESVLMVGQAPNFAIARVNPKLAALSVGPQSISNGIKDEITGKTVTLVVRRDSVALAQGSNMEVHVDKEASVVTLRGDEAEGLSVGAGKGEGLVLASGGHGLVFLEAGKKVAGVVVKNRSGSIVTEGGVRRR